MNKRIKYKKGDKDLRKKYANQIRRGPKPGGEGWGKKEIKIKNFIYVCIYIYKVSFL